MQFEVIRYVKDNGEEPLAGFLEHLSHTQPILHRLVVAKLLRLEQSAWHGPPHTTKVDPAHDIFEVRVGRKDIARVFFFFQPGQRIVLTNGYVKKQQKLDQRELQTARDYQRDWQARNP